MDATAKRMNAIAKQLRKTRQNACDQIAALGWPTDIYNDPAWYPELSITKPPPSPSKRKSHNRAIEIRESILEIDIALVAMNHYAETSTGMVAIDETEGIIEALEAVMNALTSLLQPDAEIGEKQRLNGARGGRNLMRLQAIHTTHGRWAVEDAKLKISNPSLSKKDRATRISKDHNAHPEFKKNPTKSETVRSALRRLA
jgi:hypothetical protein